MLTHAVLRAQELQRSQLGRGSEDDSDALGLSTPASSWTNCRLYFRA